ncbi:CoA transferase [Gordonia sp. Z-3]|uniref:CoA transferase n=1 Tax=Gordonia sp. Z-3 TaxID=3115408 RepID=UPI002E291C86|nr:CoA transferase [Gordonia sp. Z-3]MED5803925.1 CoA transferase [Gordonia sp. Z-3]
MSPATPRDPVRDWARSGVAWLTGHPDGPPVIPPGVAATRANELTDLIATATATAGAVRLDGAQLLAERAAFTGHQRAGASSAGGACRLLPTADGWAAVSIARPDDPALYGALIGSDDLGNDPWRAVGQWLREHPGTDLDERAELLGVAAGSVGVRDAPVVDVTGRRPRSVAGLLVVDFSALWAGPLCAHLLGLAGAAVVKVETPTRPDGARRGNADFYRLLHGGHRSVVLDPDVGDDRAALYRLASAADIVIEASRPRALRGFGLDAEEFVRSGTTWLSITACGRASNRIGFGDDVAASAGLIARDERGPVFVGDAIADPLTGLTAAALAMSSGDDDALHDISMSGVVAATLTGHHDAGVSGASGTWSVDATDGPVPIAAPRRREPVGQAPPTGADTDAVLHDLGIRR